MGTLTPGVTYIYERNGEEIYARESGSTERKLIGYQYENKIDPRTCFTKGIGSCYNDI